MTYKFPVNWQEDGLSALMVASQNGHIKVLKTMIECAEKIEINQPAKDGSTCLMLACQKGNEEVVETLLNAGGDVGLLNSNGECALTIALKLGHSGIVKKLLDFVQEDQLLNFALMLASKYGNDEVVEVILEKATKTGLQMKERWSALESGRENGQSKARGGQDDHQREDGWSPMMFDILAETKVSFHNEGETLTITSLHEKEIWSPLMIASQNGYDKVVKLLLHYDAQVILKEDDQSVALILACQKGHIEVIRLLFEESALNLNADGFSFAFMAASRNGHYGAVDILLKYQKAGWSVNWQTNEGWSALMLASQNGHYRIVKRLLENGAQVDLQSNDGQSALMLASQNGHYRIVKRLLENGAQVDLQSNDGRSALMLASKWGHYELVSLLLFEGAQVDLQADNKFSAVTFANQNGNIEVVKLLLHKGALKKEDECLTVIENGHSDVIMIWRQEMSRLDHEKNNVLSALMKASNGYSHKAIQVPLENNSRDITNSYAKVSSAATNKVSLLFNYWHIKLNTRMLVKLH